MKCYKPILIRPDDNLYPNGILVPCRKCLACQEERKKEMSIRYIHEIAKYNKDKRRENLMILLTYRDEDYTAELNKNDLKAYLKRVREYIKYNFKEEMTYIASGEYGESGSKRAHYHIVCNVPKSLKLKDYMEKSWRKGFASIRKADYGGIFYTAGYIDKKMKVERSDGRAKEFHLMSRGNGKSWILENRDKIKENGVITWQGKKINLPIYYKNKLEYSDREKIELQRKAKNYNEKLHQEMWEKYGGENYRLQSGVRYNQRIEFIEIQKLKRKELEYKQKYDRKRRAKFGKEI